jgi:2-keto-4-pentenoate hydratase/2-oxohepta-3-ene-1,7-dioic acid hydratase in catechol pathway
MKICRFEGGRIGVLRGEQVFDVTSRVTPLLDANDPGDPLVTALPRLGSVLTDLSGCAALSKSSIKLLSPVARPGKIVAAPVNYSKHIAEMQANNVSPGFNITDIGKAGLFMKANSSLVGPSQGIAQRFLDRRTDYEVELVVVIGKPCDRVTATDALSYVAAYTLGLDVTVRGTEDRSFRKSIDTYTVLGPWLTTADELLDPDQLQITLHQNGSLRQDGRTSDLVYSVARLIEFASSFYTLQPGDLLYTGTPEGVGPIRPGDVLRAECEALGAMDVAVRAA